MYGQPPHPGAGVADRGQGVQQLVQCGAGPDSFFQPMFQPLGNTPDIGEWRLTGAAGAEQGQLAPPGGGKIRGTARGGSFLIQREDRFRDVGPQGFHALLSPERPQGTGAGKLQVAVEGFAVVGTLPGQGDGRERDIQLQNCLAVFHGQIVVGLVQQSGKRGAGTEGFHSGLPGGGKAPGSGGQLCLEGGAVFLTGKHPGGVHQERGVRSLGPKNKGVAPGSGQKPNARPGKGLRPGAGAGGRQGKDKISPAAQGGLHPDGLGQEGDSAPLGQAAAHGHGYLPRAQRSGLGQLPGVAVVEWVVFSDDTGKSHREPQTL